MHPMSHRHSGPKKAISWALRFGFEGREGAAPAFAARPAPHPTGCGLPPYLAPAGLGVPVDLSAPGGQQGLFPVGRGQAGRTVWPCEHPGALRDCVTVPGSVWQ